MQTSYQQAYGLQGANSSSQSNSAGAWGNPSSGSSNNTSGGGAVFGFGNSLFGETTSQSIDEVGHHQPNASSVKEYAYTEDKNYKFRP